MNNIGSNMSAPSYTNGISPFEWVPEEQSKGGENIGNGGSNMSAPIYTNANGISPFERVIEEQSKGGENIGNGGCNMSASSYTNANGISPFERVIEEQSKGGENIGNGGSNMSASSYTNANGISPSERVTVSNINIKEVDTNGNPTIKKIMPDVPIDNDEIKRETASGVNAGNNTGDGVIKSMQTVSTQSQSCPTIIPAHETMEQSLFNQKALNNEKHKHKYIPITTDDIEGCVTFLVKMTVDQSNRLAMKEYSTLSSEFRNSSSRDTVDIGRLYIFVSRDYGDKIQINVKFINSNEKVESKRIFVDKRACVEGKLYDELKKYGLNCFNEELSHKKISSYLYKLVISKMEEKKYSLPASCGLTMVNHDVVFVTKEYCEENEFPQITNKSFRMEIFNNYSMEQSERRFIELVNAHTNKKQFLLLNIIRVASILSNFLKILTIKFNKVIFINENSEKFSKYLQIYDREYGIVRPASINVKENILNGYFEDAGIVMMEDSEDDSEYVKKNGIDAISFLSKKVYDIFNSETSEWNDIVVVFSRRLGQLMKRDKAMNLDLSGLNCDTSYSSKVIMEILYLLDDFIIKRLCTNSSDFKATIEEGQRKYLKDAEKYNVDCASFSFLMIAYHEIIKQYHSIESIVSEKSMEEYLANVIRKSDEIYNGGSISDEFNRILNDTIISGEIELVKNSAMSNCYGSTGEKPVVFSNDKYIFIPKDVFDFIVSQITLCDSANGVRKALDEKGLLIKNDSLTYKVTLYDENYSGKINVTAIKKSVLNEEARKLQLGGNYNYTPCENDDKIERIPIGIDERGKQVYWSIGHEGLGNTHILVNGCSGMGKSTAVNLIVKELYKLKKHIIYIDFSYSDTPKKLANSGIDEEYQTEHFLRVDIKSCIDKEDELKIALEFMVNDEKILVFSAEEYNDDTEKFLNMLYHAIASDSSLSVFMIIDEVHDVKYSKGSAIYNIMEKGRGNGISLISIFQGPHETKPKQYSMMNQSKLKLIFQLNDKMEAKEIADYNSLKPPGQFSETLMNLPKRKCFVIGTLENDAGEIKNGRFIEVTIPDA